MEKLCKVKIELNGIAIEMEGDRVFIENNLQSTIKLLKEELLQIAGQNIVSLNQKDNNLSENHDVSAHKKITLAEFSQQKKPKSAQDAALIIAYYLYKYEGQEEFTADDLKKRWVETKVKPPKNIGQTIIDCAGRKRWFERTQPGKYRITEHGIYAVENLFPKKK